MKQLIRVSLFAVACFLPLACSGGGGGGRAPIYGLFEVTNSNAAQGETFYRAKYVRFENDGLFAVLSESAEGFKDTVEGVFNATAGQIVLDAASTGGEGDDDDASSSIFNVVVTGGVLELRRPNRTIRLSRVEAAPTKNEWVPEIVIESTIQLYGDESDVVSDGGLLWVAGTGTALQGINFTTGSLAATLPTFNQVIGLTKVGTHFWTSGGYDYITELDITGASIRNSPIMGAWMMGLAWDGSHIWALSNNERTLYQYDPVSNTVVSSERLELDSYGGLEVVNGSLYLTSYDRIHRCEMNPFRAVQTWRLPYDSTGDWYVSGIAHDGTSFYLTARIYSQVVDNRNVLGKIQLP